MCPTPEIIVMTAPDRKTSKNRFDLLMDALPRIAETVKQIPEALQPQAFQALLEEFRDSQPGRQHTKRSNGPAEPSKGTRKLKRKRTRGPTVQKDLDLRPKDRTSLRDFARSKEPKNNDDKNVVSVYYLRLIADIEVVSIDHVFTCYRAMGWREPKDLANSLALTASKKGFLDTSTREDIKLTPTGRNHVEHDLPPKKKERN